METPTREEIELMKENNKEQESQGIWVVVCGVVIANILIWTRR